ncbi:hypothetical protein SAMN02745121_07937 [Nannocystis exedens]|uniref:Thiaminase-2/PQQC domain-containing protein n=1 Tax=Nannocystis exedens TaxID=54 RepID=A0A1I2HIK5_9BACT|nr:hypothetical protein [Nannocystis exedens]PCC70395.1 hypothetical protein NAEX_03438 [Nannocystis exedens]SFF28596.1 hypothetical protein SAMN02745121_07937 [Nannocystis exedens]
MHQPEAYPSPVLSTRLFLRERDLRGEPAALDAAPSAVRVELLGGERTIAITVVPAEAEPAAATLTGAHQAAALCDLDAPPGTPELALLVYAALQRARIWRRAAVVSSEPSLAAAPLKLSALAQRGLRAAPLDLAMHRLFTACDEAGCALLAARFVAEAAACLSRHAEAFADNAWCRAVHAGRLAREQYVAALANTHQYVRYTPRLLARAISVCDDEPLRDHFTRHFRGEQKHDRLIEADLRYLEADVEFVLRAMAPWGPTLTFMSVQESMVAFHQDLTCFLAAPFVAEGLAARVGPLVLDDLAGNIRRWGYREPARATRFLVSHAREDGGDDGHWSATLAVLARLLRDDTTQQRFLAALHLAADAFTASYDAYADYLTLFTPPLLADP